MNKLLVNPQKLIKDIDKAIKVDKEFMYSVDSRLASMSIILPPSENTKKKTKWGKISSCSKIYKDLRDLKKEVISFKLKMKENSVTAYDDCKLDIAFASFALQYKETVKNIILSKIVAQVEERVFWDELLELFDKIGFQLINDCELFENLGRYGLALKKQKEKDSQNELNVLNDRIRDLNAEKENLVKSSPVQNRPKEKSGLMQEQDEPDLVR